MIINCGQNTTEQSTSEPPIANTMQNPIHADFLFHLFTYRSRAKRVRAIHFFLHIFFSLSAVLPITSFFRRYLSALLCDRFCDLTCFIAALYGVCVCAVCECQMHNASPIFMCAAEE